MVVPTGLEPGLALLGQVRNSRMAALTLASLLCSPRFRLAASATGGASAPRPIDVSHLWIHRFRMLAGAKKKIIHEG